MEFKRALVVITGCRGVSMVWFCSCNVRSVASSILNLYQRSKKTSRFHVDARKKWTLLFVRNKQQIGLKFFLLYILKSASLIIIIIIVKNPLEEGAAPLQNQLKVSLKRFFVCKRICFLVVCNL